MEQTNKTINFELVSPEARLVSGPVKMAVIPGEEGEMGVGAGHASFIVALKAGVVKLYENDNDKPREIFIAGGFADVTSERCSVLAEEAVDVSALNRGEIEQRIKDLNEDMALAQEEADKARIQRRLDLARARLSAVSGRAVP